MTRPLATAALVLLTLAAIAACYAMTLTAFTAAADALAEPHSVNVGNLSAGVLVSGCRVQWGYTVGDGVRVDKNDSGEWRVC